MKKYDAVVIGAGNAGMFTAAGLAISGVKTLVIEAHNLPGGMATSFVRGRFEFDATLHGHFKANMVDMAENDLKLKTEFPLYPPDVELITVQNGSIHRDFYDYTRPMGPQIDEKYPGQGMGDLFMKMDPILSNVKDATIKVLDILGYLKNAQGKEASFADTVKYAAGILRKYPDLLRYGLTNMQAFYDKFKAPEYIRSLASMYWWYLGARLTDIPAFFSMAITDFHEPYAYVKDTAHSYMAEVEKIIRDNGGDILFNTAVTKINVEGNKFVGLETSQGDHIVADYCVSTIDPKIAIGQLMEGNTKFRTKTMKKEEQFKENFSFFMIYLGLDASAEEIGITLPHVIINEELDPNILWDEMGDLNAPKTIGFMCPNLIVDDVSPEGTCEVSISIPVTSSVVDGLSQKDYLKLKHEYTDKIVRKVEEYLDINLRSHIEEVVIATPATFTRYAGSKSGSLGYNLDMKQFVMVRLRTLIMNRKIKGLTFAGQFTGNLGYMNMNFAYRHGRKLANKIRKGAR